jgi:hypothetical protein
MFFGATNKPILLWPRPKSTISRYLDRSADDFIVVDTDYREELPKLVRVGRNTPIFDPFPTYGQHYSAFAAQIAEGGQRYHILGLEPCRDVLKTLKDPSLARSTIDEILFALGYLEPKAAGR